MYHRYLLPLLLCHSAAPAPQAKTDSDITYVKPHPPIEAPAAPSHFRESRIENLPLTMPGNITLEANKKVEEKELIVSDEKSPSLTESDLTLPESSNLSESVALPDASDETVKPEATLPEDSVKENLPESSVASINIAETLPENSESTDLSPQTLSDSTEHDELLEAHGSDLTDVVPSETYQSERRGRTYDSSETTDIFDEITEKYEDITQVPEILVPETKPKPKFSKLSYFQKPQGFVSFSKNLLEKSPKRRFRSHCRCEKIWNCPKLQISVPRCPDEYFLCCF